MVKYAYTYFTSTDAYMEYTVCLVFSVPFLNERHGGGGVVGIRVQKYYLPPLPTFRRHGLKK